MTAICQNCARLGSTCFHCRQYKTWGHGIRPIDGAGDFIAGDLDGPEWNQRFLDRVEKIIGHEPPAGTGWADHRYREWDEDGTPVYVSHPYTLQAQDFADLLALSEAGYSAYVTGRSAYYPGNSLRVEIRLPGGMRP